MRSRIRPTRSSMRSYIILRLGTRKPSRRLVSSASDRARFADRIASSFRPLMMLVLTRKPARRVSARSRAAWSRPLWQRLANRQVRNGPQLDSEETGAPVRPQDGTSSAFGAEDCPRIEKGSRRRCGARKMAPSAACIEAGPRSVAKWRSSCSRALAATFAHPDRPFRFGRGGTLIGSPSTACAFPGCVWGERLRGTSDGIRIRWIGRQDAERWDLVPVVCAGVIVGHAGLCDLLTKSHCFLGRSAPDSMGLQRDRRGYCGCEPARQWRDCHRCRGGSCAEFSGGWCGVVASFRGKVMS